MKITVLYHSVTGNTKHMAQIIANGVNSVEGLDAKTFLLDEIDDAFFAESKCIILGTPTYVATMSAGVKNWIDTSIRKYKFAGKIGGAFATADYIHGGGDIAVQGILSHMLTLGMLTYSGGGSFGVPVIHLGPVAIKGKLDESEDTFFVYGQRMAKKTKEIFG